MNEYWYFQFSVLNILFKLVSRFKATLYNSMRKYAIMNKLYNRHIWMCYDDVPYACMCKCVIKQNTKGMAKRVYNVDTSHVRNIIHYASSMVIVMIYLYIFTIRITHCCINVLLHVFHLKSTYVHLRLFK